MGFTLNQISYYDSVTVQHDNGNAIEHLFETYGGNDKKQSVIISGENNISWNMLKLYTECYATCLPLGGYLFQVYVHTEKNVLIEINPQTRIPRTFKRFAGLLGKLDLRICLSTLEMSKSLCQESSFGGNSPPSLHNVNCYRSKTHGQ
jgi:hypothetical protein